ncbi:MAG: LysM peptidoglycan-binding domain-containing protein [Anaerolineaceae bacterium]|nr:LysM peptidoglycan-binding domain-containing protein [Anaerolineaceae bacterium]
MAKNDPQDLIENYKKKQKVMPFVIWGLVAVLVVAGIIFLVTSLAGGESGGFKISLFKTNTPTPTLTFTPTMVPPTATATLTPTVTLTPEPTMTSTPTGPFEYTVQEDDNCWGIAVQFEVDLNVLLALNNFGGTCPIKPGDKILIPTKDQQLPTETPLPTDFVPGTKIEYTVKIGDNIDLIASRFNTTVESILEENKIEDANEIFAGQILIIKAYIVTPTITVPATSTSAVVAPTATSVP